MRFRTIATCMAAFSVMALATSAATGAHTIALWSDCDELPPSVIQSVHGTVTSQALSHKHHGLPLWEPTNATDPQTLFRLYDDEWVMGPVAGCELDSVTYEMCATYTYDVQSAVSELKQAIVDDPPVNPDTPKTYSISSVVEVDAEVWGQFGLTMGFHSTADQSGNSPHSWFVTVVDSIEDCVVGIEQVSSPVELIKRQYAHKHEAMLICHIHSYTPYLYQNTVTASSGHNRGGITHTDIWWGVYVDPDTNLDIPTLTIGVSVNE